MAHIEYNIAATPSEQEVLIAQLSEVGATGFEEQDQGLLAYFDEGADVAAIEKVIGTAAFTKNVVEERNWNQEWESSFEPVVVPGICAVRAHFHQPIAGVPHQIIITPKMSFGTGHHPTTYLMLQEMYALNFSGKKVFDFGTGTGVLAIFAEMLGAQKIEAIDVDDWSITNAQENAERNGCSCINFSLTSRLPQEKFDIVLANINRNVLLMYMQKLAELTAVGGTLLLSGLLTADADVIRAAAERHGFGFKQLTENHGWIAMVFTQLL